MYSSQKFENDIILSVYNDNRTVFRLNDIALLIGEGNFDSLNKRINYFVRTGKLQNPRKGIYTKPVFNAEELAGRIFIPSYISLEYVLQKSGIIFQYSSHITSVSYLSRKVEVANMKFEFRKLKDTVLIATTGIKRQPNGVNIATPERAMLDMMYLNGASYFDNLNSINKDLVYTILPIYDSKTLTKLVTQLLPL
jgi:hypothetical protein